jgi:hypothetical protein
MKETSFSCLLARRPGGSRKLVGDCYIRGLMHGEGLLEDRMELIVVSQNHVVCALSSHPTSTPKRPTHLAPSIRPDRVTVVIIIFRRLLRAPTTFRCAGSSRRRRRLGDGARGKE